MSKDWDLTSESFQQLLSWLDSNCEGPDAAARKYEEIRRRLIRIFAARGCLQAEELTDQTFNRVTRKLPELVNGYVGDPAHFFYGVANRVFLEQTKRPPFVPLPPAPEPSEVRELRFGCLDSCLEQLNPDDREILAVYYRDQRSAKIAARKTLAKEHQMSDNALKIRVHRLRQRLHNCVTNCLERSASMK